MDTEKQRSMLDFRTDLDSLLNPRVTNLTESKPQNMKFESIENYSLNDKIASIKKWAANLKENDTNIVE